MISILELNYRALWLAGVAEAPVTGLSWGGGRGVERERDRETAAEIETKSPALTASAGEAFADHSP